MRGSRGIGLALAILGLLGAGAPARAVATGVAPGLDPPSLRCLALNVYWEARSQSPRGQQAVAHVTLNRVAAAEFPDDVCGVVKQGGETPRWRCQFQWWCDGQSDEPTNPVAWARSQEVARRALAGESRDPTGGALFFHGASVRPSWRLARALTVRIGAHLFYR